MGYKEEVSGLFPLKVGEGEISKINVKYFHWNPLPASVIGKEPNQRNKNTIQLVVFTHSCYATSRAPSQVFFNE